MTNTEHFEAILKKTNLKSAELRGIIENLKNGFVVKTLGSRISELNAELIIKDKTLKDIRKELSDINDKDKINELDKRISGLESNIKVMKKEIKDINKIIDLKDDSSLVIYNIAKSELNI